MTNPSNPSFEIPSEMRAMAERSVEQARAAFNTFIQATQEAVGLLEGRLQASQTGAKDMSRKAMTYAERNVTMAFVFTQKLVQAKDFQDLVRLQSEYVQAQIQALDEQAKDLREIATKAAMGSTKATS